jgi:hypothetical protein
MVQVTLTEVARRQASPEEDNLVGQAHGEIDRRDWGEATAFDIHVFKGPGGDYVMYPLGADTIEVDGCIWDDLGLLKVPKKHPLHGKSIWMPRKASD